MVRIRHRIMIYAQNQRGELVEVGVRQHGSAFAACLYAHDLARGRRGALAYRTEVDQDGWEIGAPIVLARFGMTPDL